MKTLQIILVILCFQLSIQIQAQSKKQTIDSSHVHPVAFESITSFADLEPLLPLFAGKKVIGAGEASHGASEFFKLKAKLFVFLSTRANVNHFGIEADYGGCLYIDDFVRSGKGHVDSVMKHLSILFWHNTELRELILWMRKQNENRSAEDKLGFFGFDMQNPYYAFDYLSNFIRKNAPEISHSLDSIFLAKSFSRKLIYDSYNPKLRDSITTIFYTLCDHLDNWFSQNREMLKSKFDETKFQQLDMCRITFRQGCKNREAIGKNNYNCRDSCMAENVLMVTNKSPNRTFLWAHNGHINHKALSYNRSVKPMGEHLKEKLNDQYYSIGFKFHEGSFLAVKGSSSVTQRLWRRAFNSTSRSGLQEIYLPPMHSTSFSARLAQFDMPSFFVNLNETKDEVFGISQAAYDVGAVFMNTRRCIFPFTPKKMFDGLLFVKKISPAHLLTMTTPHK